MAAVRLLLRVTALVLIPVGCAWPRGGPVAQDLRATYQFLVSYRSTEGGVLQATNGDRSRVLPLSFYDSEQYWGDYVCALPNVQCAVTDYYDASDYSVKPRPGEPGDLQTERVNVHNGTNIYDAATWQIAVVLGSVVNGYVNFVREDAYDLASDQNRLLGELEREGAAAKPPMAMRATSRGKLFLYNGRAVDDPREAYAFRMISSAWLAPDPLADSRYASLITAHDLPANKQPGRIVWSDWKPVTGENAWAYLLGPLQAAYLHHVLGKKGRLVPYNEPAVQNALAILPTFATMQSVSGAVYYAPSGTLQSDADDPVSPRFTSVENNFSLYAGLRILEATLRRELIAQKSLRSEDRVRIRAGLQVIHTMIAGGERTEGGATRGLLAFFRDSAWHNGEFVQGGFADDPAKGASWVPLLKTQAVDVNTWGVAALGAARVDGWFGFGAAYRVWQSVKSWGAYGVGHTLWGVGYSDVDGNGLNPDGTYRQGVLSAEWTAGAIVMVRNMIEHYRSIRPDSPDFASARQYLQNLRNDEQAMLAGVQTLRLDRYVATPFPGKPDGYHALIVTPGKPYLYASRRYRIPFGWYANPIPSTCATAWMILIADHYDPLGYGGKPN